MEKIQVYIIIWIFIYYLIIIKVHRFDLIHFCI